MQERLLDGPWYADLGRPSMQQLWNNSIVPQYSRCSRLIATAGPRATFSVLMASMSGGWERSASSLQHTVKTHKEPGEVSFRAVHGSNKHAYVSMMSWISLVLGDALSKFPHLCESSDKSIERIRSIQIGHDDVFLHVDLKDFFMTGSPDFIVHHTALVIPKRFRPAFRAALSFILKHQFVLSKLLPGRLWRVIAGSGMGMKSSGHVSNACFLHSVEQCGLGLLCASTRAKYGIRQYSRYMDNLLFVLEGGNPNRIDHLIRDLRHSIRPFIGTLEELNQNGVTFLDVDFVKDDLWRRSGLISYLIRWPLQTNPDRV